ncbi:MAG: hypothetical protein KAT77_05855 [Nanoarchaeota archaeon]|nr:hypothetical protein [Nanoarchaeota archaeon]
MVEQDFSVDKRNLDRIFARAIFGRFIANDSFRMWGDGESDYTRGLVQGDCISCNSNWTFGKLIDETPSYLVDILEKTFSGQKYLTHQEFIGGFLDLLFGKEENFEFMKSDEANCEIAQIMQDTVLGYQMAAVDVGFVWGVYALRQAEEKRLVTLAKIIDSKYPCVVYHSKERKGGV